MKDKRKRKAKKRMDFWLAVTVLVLLTVILAPKFTPHDPYRTDLSIVKLPPSKTYPFGTDQLGRCLLSRLMAGAPATLFYAIAVVWINFFLGSMVGVLCGYLGGALDSVVMRLVDILMAFPRMVLTIAITGMLGSGMKNAMIAMCMTGWTEYARLARSRVLSMREDVFIQAEKLTGSSTSRILLFHILPNTMRVLIVTASLSVGNTIMAMAGLSFLGLGAQAPKAEWGAMLNEGRSLLQTNPNLMLFPGIFIFLVVMLFNLLGDAIRDVLDPKQK